jgi:hypothetical protein
MSNTSATAANRYLFTDTTNKGGAIGSSGSVFKFRKGILKAEGGG